jgi:oxygen-independent coproporphyrinogen-3 oxidase
MDKYVDGLVEQFHKQYSHCVFKTIYIGGGTPNHLSARALNKLLSVLSMHLAKDYEFTIECNPELLSLEQAKIFKANKVNRASIGVQTVNNTILSKFHRQHALKDVKTAIANLRKVGINNISCDFIYGFNELDDSDIDDAIKFIKTYHIPHVS